MNSANCEEVILAKMALMDGEKPLVSPADLTAHLAQCPHCRQEIQQLRDTADLLTKYRRHEQKSDLWPAIEGRLTAPPQTDSRLQRKIFFALGAMLIGYKFLEILPANDLGFFFKLVPLIMVAAVFLLLRENPLKINPELTMER